MSAYNIRIKEPAEEWLKKYDKNIQRHFVKRFRNYLKIPNSTESPCEPRFMVIGNSILKTVSG
jgi:mRNA-degrading endonuclease RelE of RelBE toxin-antitoxin system